MYDTGIRPGRGAAPVAVDVDSKIDTAIAEANWSVNGIPSQKKNASFTAGLSELGKITECESSTLIEVTIPSTSSVAWPDDAGMEFCQTGTGQLSLVAGSGVTLRSASDPAGLQARSRWSSIYVRKRPGGVDPLTTSGLLLHLKADDLSGADQSAVASWAGTGATATQATTANQPKLRTNALNGHKTVEFDGTNDMLALNMPDLARNRANLVAFIAYKLPATAVTNTRALLALSIGTGAGARMAINQRDGSGLYSASGRRLDTNGFAAAAAGSSTQGEAAVLTARFLWGSSDLYLYRNGTLTASSTTFQTDGNTSDTASLTGFIGANAAGTGEWFQGQIAEILVYNAADADGSLRANVHTYLGNNYGITMADSLGVGDEWVVSGDTKLA